MISLDGCSEPGLKEAPQGEALDEPRGNHRAADCPSF